MDILADASAAAAAHESEAASILQNLFCARPETSETSISDAEQTTAQYDAEGDDAPRPWTRDEEELLRRLALAKAGPAAKRGPGKAVAVQLDLHDWREIAEQFDDRSAMQCSHRFQKVNNPDNVKGTSARTVEPPRPP